MIENEKNFTNEIGLNEICSVRFDDYAGIEPVVHKDKIFYIFVNNIKTIFL